jgi:hypothetical protein
VGERNECLTCKKSAAVMDPPPLSPIFLMSAMDDLIFFLYFLFRGMCHNSSPDFWDSNNHGMAIRHCDNDGTQPEKLIEEIAGAGCCRNRRQQIPLPMQPHMLLNDSRGQ